MNWTAHLIAFAVFLQAIEQVLIDRQLQVLDPWNTNSALDRLQIYIHILCLAAALGALVSPHWLLTLTLLVSTYLTSVHYRGTFNGGSDTITLHVLSAVVIAQAWPELETVSALYVAVYVCFSYFVAGVSKLLSGAWRSGHALPRFLCFSNAACSNPLTASVSRLRATPIISWLVILWECAFPIGLINFTVAVFLLGAGLIFHLINFYFFGLNRFFWAWLAAYPAFLSIHDGGH